MTTQIGTFNPTLAPTDDAIRDYAYHLYEQNGCVPGRDLDNWFEASACLTAHIPAHRSNSRLHDHASTSPGHSKPMHAQTSYRL